MIDIPAAQRAIREEGLDGWLLYDNKGLNPIARDAVAPEGRMLTRRWFCLLPREGEPRWLVHAIERAQFDDRPGSKTIFAERRDLVSKLRDLVASAGSTRGGRPRLAMEYSPEAAVPAVSFVDAGTIELLRAAGADIATSGDLVQALLAKWPARGLELHLDAWRTLERAVDRAWKFIRAGLAAGRALRECDVMNELVAEMEAGKLMWAGGPNVSVNANAADPHYDPKPGKDAAIRAGDVVLIDLWGKRKDDPHAIYADVTFMAFAGPKPPEKVQRAWDTLVRARDEALAAVKLAFAEKRPIRGFEVDAVARKVVNDAGFGPQFTHRTGHSLGIEDHWIGANIDDFETRDERRIIPGTGFTIEPGIYFTGEFGLRTEIDIFVGESGPEATTHVQRNLVLLA